MHPVLATEHERAHRVFRPVGVELDLSIVEDADELWPLAKDVGTRLGEFAAGHAVRLGGLDSLFDRLE